ncbi:MAG: hypothetical protein U0168_12265 [Nannocystaceae bacterium]
MPRPPAPVEESFELDPARYDQAAGTVRVDPFGCVAVTVAFSPPEGFAFETTSGDARWWRAPGSADLRRAYLDKTWPDFVTISVECARERDAASRAAARAKAVEIDRQPEHPFRPAPPEVSALRQRFEILAERSEDATAVLEFRNTFPDGLPSGQIFDKYEGRCWRLREDAWVVVALEIETPLAREAEAREWLAKGCEQLATATITVG